MATAAEHPQLSAIHGPIHDPAVFDEKGWAKVVSLETSIAAVERQQAAVETAISRRSSFSGVTDRIKHLLVGADEHGDLEESLRWLRRKEGQLRKEKLLFIQNEVYRYHQSRAPPVKTGPVTVNGEHVVGPTGKPSYFSSPPASSAAAAAFAFASATATACGASRGDLISPPPQAVTNPGAPIAGGSRYAAIRTYFKGFRRMRGRSETQVHGRRAYAAWWRDEEEDSETEQKRSRSLGRNPLGPVDITPTVDYGGENPIWERSGRLGSSDSSVSCDSLDEKSGGRTGVGASGYSSEGGTVRGRSRSWRSSWRRGRGGDRKNGGKGKKKGSFTDEKSDSGGGGRSVPPRGRTMMRGSSQRGTSSTVLNTDESPLAFNAARRSLSVGTYTGQTKRSDSAELELSPELNRKVRFDVPTSQPDPCSPLVSPRARFSTSAEVRRSAAALAERDADIGTTSSRRSLPHKFPSNDSVMHLAGTTKLTTVDGQRLRTATARRKLLRRVSSDEGALNAEAVVENESAILSSTMKDSSDDSKTAEQVATAALQAAALWVAGAYSPTTASSTRATSTLAGSTLAESSMAGSTVDGSIATIPSPSRSHRRDIGSDSTQALSQSSKTTSHRRVASSCSTQPSSIPPRAPRPPKPVAAVPKGGAPTKMAGAPVATAPVAARTRTTGGSMSPSPGTERGRDTLERMHNVLTSTLALMDTEDRRRSRDKEVLAALKWTVAMDGDRTLGAKPSVWVTGYVDRSKKYGLGYLLSNNCIGARFNDATKMILEPDGKSFEYIERPSRRSKPSSTNGRQPPSFRHFLTAFPYRLQKKVKLLKYFREDLQKLAKDVERLQDSPGSSDKHDKAAGGSRDSRKGNDALSSPDRHVYDKSGGSPASADKGGGIGSGNPATCESCKVGCTLPFVEQWRRTRHSCLFLLSDLTLQVVFADTSEILLTGFGSVVTFVSKTGSRETFPLEKLMENQRVGVIKRVRYTKDLIMQLLTREQRVKVDPTPKIGPKASTRRVPPSMDPKPEE